MILSTSPSAAAVQKRLKWSFLHLIEERRGFLRAIPRRLSMSMVIASALMCLLFVIAFVLSPLWKREVTVVELPERAVKLMAQIKPETPPPAREVSPPIHLPLKVNEMADAAMPAPPPEAPERVRRAVQPSEIDNDASRAGRARAQQATARLASATASIDRTLGDVAALLKDTGSYQPTRSARERGVRGGRSEGQLGSVDASLPNGGGSADLHGSVEAPMLAIGGLSAGTAPSAASSDDAIAPGAAPGVYRTNASLLAVIQRYAAGIQYCYSAELKRDPSLAGKIVVAIVVAPSGEVTQADIVHSSIRSERLSSCVLSQIRDWRFPPIKAGMTSFQAPFVFTPPN
ncbi:MAG TPA: AgmX/PglI C-terminal domain-containing protein [Candidatus Udaeobacter sp.]|jgi:TonB family protein|nr:AgmX/PglI C-terminal domain-containing protein [Candidatus Udaeobacter sp.]